MKLSKLHPLLNNSTKIICVFSLLLTWLFVLPPLSHAQNFPKNPIQCDDKNDNDLSYTEYHSLRPLPFSPCNTEVSGALQCGNTVYISDSIPRLRSCAVNKCCTVSYSEFRSGNVTIDFTNSELPIVGNTEDVANWDSPTDSIVDTEKVNRYVSWYLNGVVNRAEYPFLSWKKKEDIEKLVNFSGPMRKLLPQRIQDDAREKQVAEVLDKRHNQIVACTYGINILFSDKQIGAIPGRCVNLGILSGLVQKKRRILEWKDNLPPKREDEDFENYTDYYKEYRAWRGDKCWSVPIKIPGIPIKFDLLLCFDNPLEPNFYGDLYPYIPFSSTEDRVGLVKKEVPTEINLGNLKLSNISYDAGDLNLYYAHMQENVELSDLLRKSYLPKEGTGGEGKTTPVEVGGGCQMINIRTNPGDHLVDPGWSPNKKQVSGTLSYTANWSCTYCGILPTSCTVYPIIPISLTTQNPLHDELWHNLVGGADSIFRRFFPKTGEGTPVIAPRDIPGTTTFDFEKKQGIYTVDSGGEIYFPHLGGISEYFLNAIQTALRPQGYGHPIDPGDPSSDDVISSNCSPGTGPCSVNNLLPYFDNSVDKATKASIICNRESGSNSNAKNDGCLSGRTCDYSIGLFQINLLAHCPGAFSSYSCNAPIHCTVGNQSKLHACETRLLDPIENIKEAVRISNNGTNWTPWSAAAVCGIQ